MLRPGCAIMRGGGSGAPGTTSSSWVGRGPTTRGSDGAGWGGAGGVAPAAEVATAGGGGVAAAGGGVTGPRTATNTIAPPTKHDSGIAQRRIRVAVCGAGPG